MEVRIEPQPGHVRVVVKGEFDAAVARMGVVSIVAACHERGVDAVLIDGRGITSPISVLDRYEIAKALADEARRRLRLAIVVTRENMTSKTFEETAVNMGMDVRTTESMAEALTYLGMPLSK